jgi:hypothetical protein
MLSIEKRFKIIILFVLHGTDSSDHSVQSTSSGESILGSIQAIDLAKDETEELVRTQNSPVKSDLQFQSIPCRA